MQSFSRDGVPVGGRHLRLTACALAREPGESGAHEEALKLYERVAAKGASGWPLDRRIGVEQQALGRNDAAKVARSCSVSTGKGPKASLEDARNGLQPLGAEEPRARRSDRCVSGSP